MSYELSTVLSFAGYEPLIDYVVSDDGRGNIRLSGWYHSDPKPTTAQVEAWAIPYQRQALTKAAYAQCATLSEQLVTGYSPAERSSWTQIAEEAKACKDSGYVTIGDYMAEEIAATPSLDAKTLADKVLAKAAAFRGALAKLKGVRTVICAELDAMTDEQLLQVDEATIKTDPRWSSGA